MAACGIPQSEDCEDCVQVVKDVKTVQVPCTRNTFKQYTVKVPRQVSEQVPRTVHYTDYESRSKQVPYTVNRSEERTRMETQKYTVPVTTTNTRMVPVTKKVPKTVYVNVTQHVPQKYNTTTMQTRERQVPVPYYVNVPETKYRTVTEQVPVTKTKVQMETVTKTVYDTQVRTRCHPETKVVSKQIPVYNVIAKPAPPCPPGADCGGNVMEDFNRIDKDGDGMLNYNEVAFDAADANKDGKPSFGEYYDARAAGYLSNTAAGVGRETYGQINSGNFDGVTFSQSAWDGEEDKIIYFNTPNMIWIFIINHSRRKWEMKRRMYKFVYFHIFLLVVAPR